MTPHTLALIQRHCLGSHQIEIGADAGSPRVRRHHTAGIAESPLDGQGILLGPAHRRSVWWEWRGRPKNGDQSTMMIGGHLQRQIGDREQRVE